MITASGRSMNGETTYSLECDVQLPQAAREMLRTSVIDQVRQRYGITPEGVQWLIDPRTIETKEATR